MPKCYFKNNINESFSCQYVVKDLEIQVDVEYDIGDEIESENGVRVWSTAQTFEKRDILIVDEIEKKFYLLKDAIYCGMNSRMGTLDDYEISSFSSNEYFESNSPVKLIGLPKIPKIKSIKVYSSSIADYYGHPSVKIDSKDNEVVYTLAKNKEEKNEDINNNNIAKIFISDYWKSVKSSTSISIEMSGYLGIEFINVIDYTELYKYLNEVTIYMQLFYPRKFRIDKVSVKIDDENYYFVTNLVKPIETTKKKPQSQILCDLGFLT